MDLLHVAIVIMMVLVIIANMVLTAPFLRLPGFQLTKGNIDTKCNMRLWCLTKQQVFLRQTDPNCVHQTF